MRILKALPCVVLALGLLHCSAAGPGASAPQDADRKAVLDALQRSLAWLESHPPNAHRAKLGALGMDAWAWSIFARLHPEATLRERAAEEARRRLRGIPPRVEPTATSVSWWALLLRVMQSHQIDTAPHRAALSAVDLADVLHDMNPTTAFWTTQLLRHSGMAIESTML